MKIMSNKEYKSLRHRSPYIYQLEKNNKHLLILGARHLNEPKHPQFSALKTSFRSFKPEFVFFEGGWERDEGKYKSQKQAVEYGGEMALIAYLTAKEKLPKYSWEPTHKQEMQLLLRKFKKEEIFAFYILRSIPGEKRRGKKELDFLSGRIKRFKEKTGWKSFDYSIERLNEIYKKTFKEELNIENYRDEYTWPIKNISNLNKIAQELGKLRDKNAVKVITKSLEDRSRVAAIMGESHAVIQEPAYREYFKKLK